MGQSMSGAEDRRSLTCEFGMRGYWMVPSTCTPHSKRHLVRGLGVTLVCTLPATCSVCSDSVFIRISLFITSHLDKDVQKVALNWPTVYLGNSCSHFDLHRASIKWDSIVLLHSCNYSDQTRSSPTFAAQGSTLPRDGLLISGTMFVDKAGVSKRDYPPPLGYPF